MSRVVNSELDSDESAVSSNNLYEPVQICANVSQRVLASDEHWLNYFDHFAISLSRYGLFVDATTTDFFLTDLKSAWQGYLNTVLEKAASHEIDVPFELISPAELSTHLDEPQWAQAHKLALQQIAPKAVSEEELHAWSVVWAYCWTGERVSFSALLEQGIEMFVTDAPDTPAESPVLEFDESYVELVNQLGLNAVLFSNNWDIAFVSENAKQFLEENETTLQKLNAEFSAKNFIAGDANCFIVGLEKMQQCIEELVDAPLVKDLLTIDKVSIELIFRQFFSSALDQELILVGWEDKSVLYAEKAKAKRLQETINNVQTALLISDIKPLT